MIQEETLKRIRMKSKKTDKEERAKLATFEMTV
jgi:hypothetical protein